MFRSRRRHHKNHYFFSMTSDVWASRFVAMTD